MDLLTQWFAREGLETAPFVTWERVNLKDFLQRTSHIALPPEERLRHLAILAEPIASSTTQPRGWALLERMYDTAARWDSHNPWIEHSRAISAMACADGDVSTATRAAILESGRIALARALSMVPEDGLLLSTMSQLEYADHQTEAALEWADRALAVEPGRPWASLIRAHCLSDLKQWADAAAAYDAVPQDAFQGPGSWRMALLVEQMGWCRLKAGDTDGARAAFEQIVYRYSANVKLARTAMSRLVVRAAKRHFPELAPEVRAIAQALGWQWAQDMLEP